MNMAWRLIEDGAPKDGAEILAWDGYDFSLCRWSNGVWSGVCDGMTALASQGSTWTDYIEPTPTHWAPLPNPPAPA
jgi:hypothetical protein